MKNTSQFTRWGITLVTCGTIAVILFYINQGQSNASVGQTPPELPEMVEAIQVSSTIWSPKTKALGEVVATRTITLRNELEGSIITLNLPSGGEVTQGQTLVQLDTSEEQARLANAKASLELAEIELRRNKQLYQQKIVSQDNYDKARIQVTIRQAEVQAINSLINKKTIKAPFNAITGLHTLEVGQYLSANSEINTLVGIDQKIWVDFKLPQQFANINKNSDVLIQSPHSEQSIKGKIVAQNTLLNKAARSLTFRAQIDNNQQLLKPGTVVSVLAPTTEPQEALKIPTSAIMRDQFANYVYLLTPAKDNKNYRAQRREIELGGEHGSDTVVTSGLVMNDLIVSIGAFKLRPDMLVTFNPKAALDQAAE
ncbi:efflux RND transporter periplasmic adaptor subunit [Paraglaciecola aquimarina]|uniref:Efflux RND transporter periplasmic adaptor subunit n=1 Tax=Paraglaciecola algarum TaxID=3050085 RepID=A0ABS9D8C4_9ALTE|nr:efflux RND transporter periplasmic adaptor subunit [Paraglaciecola sp. G1-23]MCF2948247.1 efflux RND transporter periplasmic adaptor subunit [Paraglaciecola sp. G1-23]